MESLLSNSISLITTVLSGVLVFLIQRFFQSQRKKEERRYMEQSEDNGLILRSIHALGQLTIANAIALRDGKTNGEMSNALQEYKKIEEETYEYLVSHHLKSR